MLQCVCCSVLQCVVRVAVCYTRTHISASLECILCHSVCVCNMCVAVCVLQCVMQCVLQCMLCACCSVWYTHTPASSQHNHYHAVCVATCVLQRVCASQCVCVLQCVCYIVCDTEVTIHSIVSSLFIRKRALNIRKRALYIRVEEPYISTKKMEPTAAAFRRCACWARDMF